MDWNKEFLKKTGIFALFVLGFWFVSMIYLSPALDGQMIRQGDMTQSRLMRANLVEYRAETGRVANWAPNIFGGMPSNLIIGKPVGNFIYNSGFFRLFNLVKGPFDFLFIAMLSMFVLLKSAKVNNWLAAAGAIGYAFMTFSVISYEAGHITKVQAMAVMPGVLAGLMLLIRRKYFLGTIVTGLFFAGGIGFFHYQIAFYIGIALGVFALGILIVGIISKEFKHTGLVLGCLLIGGLMAIASNSQRISDTMNYQGQTMRGGSALNSETPEAGAQNTTNTKGLSIDYAYDWSYMPKELFTLIVPRFMGGSSQESIGYNEDFNTDQPLPLYHGNLKFTSGPIYIGAVFMVLFIAAFVICFRYLKDNKEGKQREMVLLITTGVALTFFVSVILALGKYVGFNTFLFEHLPFYNKFRTPMMALSIAQMIIPFYSMYGLHLMFEQKEEGASAKLFIPVLISVGVLLFITFLTIKMQEYNGLNDSQFGEGNYKALSTIKEIRESVATKDFMRTLGLASLALLLVYLTIKKIMPKNAAWASLAVLCSFDMIGVSNRYLTEQNWQDKEEQTVAPPSQFDLQLQAANKDQARVLDLRADPFNDNNSVPYHRNIGGYHPAKLSYYQDLISYGITPNGGQLNSDVLLNNNALDMMNCKYVLTSNQSTRASEVIPRQTALGNAWFVQTVNTVSDPKAWIAKVNKMDVSKEVVFLKDEKQPLNKTYDLDLGASSIVQTYFSPDTIIYKSKNAKDGLAVFSEVFYTNDESGWIAKVDKIETPILKANYLLRSIDIPAGEHTIEFVFKPRKEKLKRVEKTASALLMLGLLVSLVLSAMGKKVKWINA